MNESGWLFSFSRINQAHGDGTRSQSAHRNTKKVTNENIIRLDPFRETIQKNFQIVFSFLFFPFERRSIGINLCRCHSWLSWRQILQQSDKKQTWDYCTRKCNNFSEAREKNKSISLWKNSVNSIELNCFAYSFTSARFCIEHLTWCLTLVSMSAIDGGKVLVELIPSACFLTKVVSCIFLTHLFHPVNGCNE